MLKLAALSEQLNQDSKNNSNLAANWGVVRNWNVDSRYELSGLGSDMNDAVNSMTRRFNSEMAFSTADQEQYAFGDAGWRLKAGSEGYLVDYDAVTIKSNVRINGIFLHEGEQVRLVDTASGAEQMDLLEDERQFDTSDIEEKITAPDSNRKIMEEVKKYALEHQGRYQRVECI